MSTQVIDTAISYVKAGISVLPIRADGSKSPLLEKGQSWTPWQTKFPTTQEIAGWYQFDAGGVGIIAGKVSGGLEIIDIEDPETTKSWIALVEKAGFGEVLHKLVFVKSPRGYHVYFRTATPGRNTDLARRHPTQEEIANRPDRKYYKLIETRGEGGYVLAPGCPPSCHPDGKEYQWFRGDFLNIPILGDEEREVLFECARSLNQYFENKEYIEPSSQIKGTDRPGDLFNARATWAEILEPIGWRLEGPGRWIRPGGKRASAVEIINGERLYAVSSNVPGLELEKSYNKFSVYALLTHGGNFQNATRELAAKGYCKPQEPQTNFAPPASDESQEEFDVDIPLWPTLGPEAFYGISGRVVEIATEKSEADPAAVLATFLVRAGATFGAKAFFKVGETKHHPRLFSIVVGNSSKARKGTSLGPVDRIFEIAETRAHAVPLEISPGPLSSGEGLINAVRDAVEVDENEEEAPKKKQKADKGVKDKRLFVIEAEFAGALRAMQRQGNNISAIIRTAWDKGNIAPLTRNNPIKTTGAHIVILGHITRQELLMLMEKVEVWNGFANRFLWFCARRSKYVPLPEEMDNEIVSNVATELAAAIQFGQQERVINFHPEVVSLWLKLYPSLTQELDGIIGSVTSRSEAQVIRIALVYALLDRSDMIRMPHMLAAIAVWQYCLNSVKYIFKSTATENEDDTLGTKVIEALRAGEKTQKQLIDYFNRNVSAAKLSTALMNLQASGRVSQRTGESTGKGGRKPVFWSLAIGGESGGS